MNPETLLQEIAGYEKQKADIQREIDFKKQFVKSLDKKIKAVQELIKTIPHADKPDQKTLD